MPELFVLLQRYDSSSSKSFRCRPRAMRKVLPLAGSSSVVSPWITPSRTFHSPGSPSQPVRLVPLNSVRHPAAGSALVNSTPTATVEQRQQRLATRMAVKRQRNIVVLQSAGGMQRSVSPPPLRDNHTALVLEKAVQTIGSSAGSSGWMATWPCPSGPLAGRAEMVLRWPCGSSPRWILPRAA